MCMHLLDPVVGRRYDEQSAPRKRVERADGESNLVLLHAVGDARGLSKVGDRAVVEANLGDREIVPQLKDRNTGGR